MTTTATRPPPVDARSLRKTPIVIAAVGAFVLIAVWIVAFSPVLGVRHVVVTGTHTLNAADVQRAAAVEDGAPLVRLDTAAVRNRVEAIPDVASAYVSVSYPSTVRIAVHERVPVGYLTGAQSPTASQARSPDPVFSGALPEGIDCQRCHGPGARHIHTAQTPGAKPAEISASIVNPARLSPKLQMDTCMECHLEPTSGRLPALIRRFNREPFSYIPGQSLEDFILYFDHPAGRGYDDKFEIHGRYRGKPRPELEAAWADYVRRKSTLI